MPGNPELVVPVPAGLALGIECDEIIVSQPAGTPSPNVIDVVPTPAPDWTLTLRFRVGGIIVGNPGPVPPASGFTGAAVPGQVMFYYEGFGAGAPEGQIGPVLFDSADGVALGGMVYEYNIPSPSQPAGLLPSGTTYKLSAVVNFPGWNMNAFIEGQPISVASA